MKVGEILEFKNDFYRCRAERAAKTKEALSYTKGARFSTFTYRTEKKRHPCLKKTEGQVLPIKDVSVGKPQTEGNKGKI
jgi:hypothetical protein